METAIREYIDLNPKTSLRKIAAYIQNTNGQNISYNSCRNYLHGMNLYAFSPIKKPFLRPNNNLKRFACSKEWIKMREDKLRSIIFSDKSKFNLFTSDGKCSVWREPGTGLKNKNLSPLLRVELLV